MQHFRHREEYREAWDNCTRKVPPIPLNLDIELASACNLKCSFCYHARPDFNPQPAFMDTECALSLLDEAQVVGIPAIKFNFRGESTIHPDYRQIVEEAARMPFHDLMANSNFQFPNPDRVLPALHLMTRVIASVDSMDRDSYEATRGGSYWVAMENIRAFLMGKPPTCRFIIRRVVTPENQHEPYREMVREAFGAGDYIVGENLVFDRTGKLPRPDTEFVACEDPFRRLAVLTDGTILACCGDWRGEYKVGNWMEGTMLDDAWNSIKIENLRGDILAGMPPAHCQKCDSWRAFAGRGREMIKGVEQ